MDQPKTCCHTRRASAGSQKLLLPDSDFVAAKFPHYFTETQNHASSPCRRVIGTHTRLNDLHNSLITSKELLKVMSRVSRLDPNSTSSSLFAALKFELDRAYNQVVKLIQEHKSSSIEILIKRLEHEKAAWKMKEQDRIRSAITAIAGEFETERKLRRQTERLNKKLGRELLETKASLLQTGKELESEKRAQKLLQQACDELGRAIGEDRAEVEELKKQSAEVEKEREMLQLDDLLREESMQTKLSEAKYQFEEKNELVDELRRELESYLKSKTIEEHPEISELKNYLRETLPASYQHQDKDNNCVESDEEDSDSSDSDLHSIELNVDDLSKSFQRRDEAKRIKKQRNPGLLEFASQPWKKETEDEMERYNMIKDLRDHIVSSSRLGSSASPSKSLRQEGAPPKDPNEVACSG